MTTIRLSPRQIDELRDAVTRDEVLALLATAGAPIKRGRARADFLYWLVEALGLSDAIVFEETEGD